jgi:hypothetical protein
MSERHHIALHLAHRWFAFFEAPGGDLATHLAIFSPQVRLSGHRGGHLFAHDHASLVAWFDTIPEAISSHHIVHSTYATADDGDGVLNLVVAYQSPVGDGMQGAIISYETRIEFSPDGARFVALDKTPTLANTRRSYETSWSTNRVLARVHAELGGVAGSDGQLRAELGNDVRQVFAHAVAAEGSRFYQALVTSSGGAPAGMRVVCLALTDNGKAAMPEIAQIMPFALT